MRLLSTCSFPSSFAENPGPLSYLHLHCQNSETSNFYSFYQGEMEPVARRTRRQRNEALLKEYSERKKIKPSVIVLSRPSSSSSESETELGSTRSHVLRKVEKDDLLSSSSSKSTRSPALLNVEKDDFLCSSSSSSESEEEDDESEYAEEKEGDDDQVEELVEVKDEFSAFGTFERPIVLGDGDEEEEKEKEKEKEEEEEEEEDEEEDEEEEVEEEKEVVVQKDKMKVRPTKGPLTATEIQKVLLNSIMEEAIEIEVPRESPESSYSSEVDSGDEMEIKDPEQEEIDEAYRIMNACLAYLEDGVDAGTSLVDEHITKNQEQLCREGKHHLIVNEEIGILCRFCRHVTQEIRDVLPDFHHNPFATSRNDDEYRSAYRGPKNPIYFEDPNIEAQHFKSGAEFDTTGTVWEIMSGLRDDLLHQQREAFEFIWRNVAGGTNLNELMKKKTTEGGGCLISHAPGTGKTRLAIAFLQTYMKFCKNSRPVVLAPASILLSWKQEFQKWKVDVPFLNLNEDELSETEMCNAGLLFGRSGLRNLNTKAKRLIKLLFWKRHESVLAVSYNLFQKIVNQDEKLRDLLIEAPGVLVLDEAHVVRNKNSLIFKALNDVKTKKRILLSGTPFQNNFGELRNILCLMRKEFNDETLPFKKSHVDESDEGKIKHLKEKMKPFCHCYGNQALLATLPGLVEKNIYLQPSELQKQLLKHEEKKGKNHLKENVNTALISIHPMLLHCEESKTGFTQELKSKKWDITDGAKARFLIRFIEMSSALKERVLVFSQYLQPLNFIKAILQSEHFGWREGVEIHLMDGSQMMKKRKRTMDEFNMSKGKAKVMLASTKACSEGITFTGASRVILLDVTWNPAVEKQAIGRAFRMGQERIVHVYHLIMTTNDNNRHLTQNQKNNFSSYMFSLNDKSGPQSSIPEYEDIILDRLREENIILDACIVNTSNNRF